MKLDPTPIPAAVPVAATPVAATPAGPTDEAHKRAIADAVWTDLLWLMPPDRTVTIAVDGVVVAGVGDEVGPVRTAVRRDLGSCSR